MSLTAEQLQARSRGIGGSDAAVALGLSPWKSALELFHEKRAPAGSVENVPTEPMRWGTLLEPVIRQEYSNRTGRVVRVPETTLVHPAHAFMLANVDGVTTDGRLLEVKTSRTAQGRAAASSSPSTSSRTSRGSRGWKSSCAVTSSIRETSPHTCSPGRSPA